MALPPGADELLRVTLPVLLIGTFDTKGAEYAHVRSAIMARGHRVLTMDLGVLEDTSGTPFPVDIRADEVAEAGGTPLADLRRSRDRGAAVLVMEAGARRLTRALFEEGRFGGVLKVMVSTMASGNTAPYVGVKDITMMYSVTDIAGLNPISARILSNAAGAISGMLEQTPGEPAQPGHTVGRLGGPVLMVLPTAGLLVVSLGFAVAMGPLYELCQRAASDLLDPTAYIEAVLR